jgi:rubrerythrin
MIETSKVIEILKKLKTENKEEKEAYKKALDAVEHYFVEKNLNITEKKVDIYSTGKIGNDIYSTGVDKGTLSVYNCPCCGRILCHNEKFCPDCGQRVKMKDGD